MWQMSKEHASSFASDLIVIHAKNIFMLNVQVRQNSHSLNLKIMGNRGHVTTAYQN